MKYLHIIAVNFFENLFLSEGKEYQHKPLDIILFIYSRGIGKRLLYCNRLKDTQVMGVCLHHMKRLILFFIILPLYAVNKSKTYSTTDSLFMAKHDGAN